MLEQEEKRTAYSLMTFKYTNRIMGEELPLVQMLSYFEETTVNKANCTYGYKDLKDLFKPKYAC